MQNREQQLEAQVIQLKARLLDAKDNAERANEVISLVAQKVGYQGQEVDGLIHTVEALTKKQEEVTESE